MEYLQYSLTAEEANHHLASFKPCYKWNTFNTKKGGFFKTTLGGGFKPCYKWNTFNT